MSGRRRNAWLTPDTGTGATLSRCLTFPRELLPYVTGALSALTEPWRWEQYGTMTPGEAAYLATAMLDQFIYDCEGTNVLLRQNETTPCILERSDDNGVTWVQFADLSLCATEPEPEPSEYSDVRENPTTGELEFSLDGGITWTDIPVPSDDPPTSPWAPARSPQPGATQDEQRCSAASRAATALNTMYQQTYGAIGAGLLNTLSGINAFLRDLNNFLADIVWGEYWDIAQAVGFENNYSPTQYAAASLGEDAYQRLVCLLYDNATVGNLGVVSFDFGAVRDNVISELGINPGTAVWTHLNYVGEAGLNRLGEIGFGNQDDCVLCDLEPGYWFDWVQTWGETDRVVDNGPGAVTFPQGHTAFWASFATAIHGEGHAVMSSTSTAHVLVMQWDGLPTLTDRIEVSGHANSTGGTRSQEIYVNGEATPRATFGVPNATQGNNWQTYTFPVTEEVSQIRIVQSVTQTYMVNVFNGLRMWWDGI